MSTGNKQYVFIYSAKQKMYLQKLHGQPTLSQEFQKTYNTIPLNKAKINNTEVEYTVCFELNNPTYPREWIENEIKEHEKQWKDTIVLGEGEIIEIRGERKF